MHCDKIVGKKQTTTETSINHNNPRCINHTNLGTVYCSTVSQLSNLGEKSVLGLLNETAPESLIHS